MECGLLVHTRIADKNVRAPLPYLIRKILRMKGIKTIKYSSIFSLSSFSRAKFQMIMPAIKALMT
jgi:hypothetical protein